MVQVKEKIRGRGYEIVFSSDYPYLGEYRQAQADLHTSDIWSEESAYYHVLSLRSKVSTGIRRIKSVSFVNKLIERLG